MTGFKQPVSVLVVIHTPALDVLLLERSAHPGFWQSVTGSREGDEGLADTARREVGEETGIVASVVEPLGDIDFWFMADGRRVHKTVHHFLMVREGGDLCDDDPEVESVEWVPLTAVNGRLAYSDERALLKKARARLSELP